MLVMSDAGLCRDGLRATLTFFAVLRVFFSLFVFVSDASNVSCWAL
jgi:hypothetical protein